MSPRPPQHRSNNRRPARSGEPVLRRGTVRISDDIATRIRGGNPYLFRDALKNRALTMQAAESLEIVDESGDFVARGLFDPEGPVAVRVVGRDAAEVWGPEAIRRRVEDAKRLRDALITADTTAYRVFHGEGDGLPGVAIERYGEHFVVQLFSSGLEPLGEGLYDALEAVYRPASIYVQRRYRPQTGEGQRAAALHVRGATAPVEIEVLEHGLKFIVDVTAPLSTGLFPDLRLARRSVGEAASGKRVLNLFSYTGAFSVWAAHGGAREVVSVDVAQKAHARARRNLAANALAEAGHELVAADAFSVLARMAERGRRFDLVVVDPPSFGQAKGARVFSAQKDYAELVESALSVVAPGGTLLSVCNTWKMSTEDLDRALGEAAGRCRRELRVVARQGLPPDFPVAAGFPEGHYLKASWCVAS